MPVNINKEGKIIVKKGNGVHKQGEKRKIHRIQTYIQHIEGLNVNDHKKQYQISKKGKYRRERIQKLQRNIDINIDY